MGPGEPDTFQVWQSHRAGQMASSNPEKAFQHLLLLEDAMSSCRKKSQSACSNSGPVACCRLSVADSKFKMRLRPDSPKHFSFAQRLILTGSTSDSVGPGHTQLSCFERTERDKQVKLEMSCQMEQMKIEREFIFQVIHVSPDKQTTNRLVRSSTLTCSTFPACIAIMLLRRV